MTRSPDDPICAGYPSRHGSGLLRYAPMCYKQLYAQMDERALEAPQEARGQPRQGSKQRTCTRAFAAKVL